jgi:hypothetical protein
VTRVTEATMPEGCRGAGDEGLGNSRKAQGYKDPELLHLTIMLRVSRSFTEQPNGSNSTKELLSVVNWRTEMRFLISCGETRTLLRCKDSDMAVVPVVVTGKKEPLLTTIEEELENKVKWKRVY